MINITSSGSFKHTDSFLKKTANKQQFKNLQKLAEEGVNALSSATPVDSSLTAKSWYYEIVIKNGKYTIIWKNKNVSDNVSVAILIQYGHLTGTGGWVQGRDFINPAIRPIFDKIANDVWKEVTKND